MFSCWWFHGAIIGRIIIIIWFIINAIAVTVFATRFFMHRWCWFDAQFRWHWCRCIIRWIQFTKELFWYLLPYAQSKWCLKFETKLRLKMSSIINWTMLFIVARHFFPFKIHTFESVNPRCRAHIAGSSSLVYSSPDGQWFIPSQTKLDDTQNNVSCL